MIKTILCILALCSITLAQQQPSGPGSGCLWLNVCAGGAICVFNPSPAVGCEIIGVCSECYRGFTAQPNDAKTTDLTRQFVGHFKAYKWRGKSRTRFVVAMPGVLAEFGVEAGDVVSKINSIRVTPRFLILAPTLKGASVTTYKVGQASKARSVKL